MSENASPPEEVSKQSKTSGKHKWRGKLFSTEGWRGKDAEEQTSNEDQLTQFLGGSTAEQPRRRSPLPVAAPRLEVAQKQQQHAIAPIESDLSPVQDYYRRPRPPLKKGLTVGFVETAPVIIGEGGDDADLPASEVARSLARLNLDEPAITTTLRRRSTGFSSLSSTDLTGQEGAVFKRQQQRERQLAALPPVGSDYDDGRTTISKRMQDRTPNERNKPLPVANELGTSHNQLHPALRGRHRPDVRGSPSPDRLRTGNSLTPSPSPQPLIPPAKRPVPGNVPSPPPHVDHQSGIGRERSPLRQSDSAAPRSTPKANLRSVAQGLGRDALDEFDSIVRDSTDIFQTGVINQYDTMEIPLSSWTRAGVWWFLKGRQELESAVRSLKTTQHQSPSDIKPPSPRKLMQSYVDLAKAWWIFKDITPHHPDITKYGSASMSSMIAIIESFGDRDLAELVEMHVAVIANLRALTISMKRNGRLPPQPFDIQGLDSSIFLEYPRLPDHVVNVDHDSQRRSGSKLTLQMPLSDTPQEFTYGRMFVNAALVDGRSRREQARMQCLVSVLQKKEDGGLHALIATQDGQFSIAINPDEDKNSTFRWKRLQWAKPSQSLILPLSGDIILNMRFSDSDFQTFDKWYEDHANARRAFTSRNGEKPIFDCHLRQFERLEMPNQPGGFPQGPVANCRLRLFSRQDNSNVLSQGHNRLVILTPPSIKTLRSVSMDLDGHTPVLVAPWQRGDRLRLTVRTPNSPSFFLEFGSEDDLETFQLVISATSVSKNDHAYPRLPISGYDISSRNVETPPTKARSLLKGLRWRSIQVITEGRDYLKPSSNDQEVMRLITKSDFGSLVEKLSSSPGELQISLEVESINVVKILRSSPCGVTWVLQDRLPGEVVLFVQETSTNVAKNPSDRRFVFESLQDANNFQAQITGFAILFDRNASSFSISRRRMVVPIHKKWEASSVRLQILQKDKYIQLVAFYKDFQHGVCMNFELKPTDVFETSSKSGAFFLRIVDAKFPLPKTLDIPDNEFLSLDTPEYPGEHDDIMIAFDSEEDRDHFASHLPATANKASRLGSLRR